MLIEYIVINLLVGTVAGIIAEFNEKILFFIWLGVVITSIYGLTSGNMQLSSDEFPLWYYLITIPSTLLGFKAGRITYVNVFGEKQKKS